MIQTVFESIHTRTIAKILERNSLERFFSCAEIEYCRQYKDMDIHLAGCLAAKRAFLKISHIADLKKIEIKHTNNGKPCILLDRKRLRSCCVSISHTGSIAVALCGINNGKICSSKKKKRHT
ncbi:MAG TPA: 4'-phosphopantetheinyl transferase superfamily protein [bacterium]|nr:4'-phosphopantetheinyl transferase superfamily protein [bacterium]